MDYIEINRKLWNKKTKIHYNSDFYDVDSFIKGKNSLNQIEVGLLGDVKGKKILHLQCHFGQDTISLARHGAFATGVDFSETAIKKAQNLNKLTGTNATFIQSDIYKLPGILDEKLKKGKHRCGRCFSVTPLNSPQTACKFFCTHRSSWWVPEIRGVPPGKLPVPSFLFQVR